MIFVDGSGIDEAQDELWFLLRSNGVHMTRCARIARAASLRTMVYSPSRKTFSRTRHTRKAVEKSTLAFPGYMFAKYDVRKFTDLMGVPFVKSLGSGKSGFSVYAFSDQDVVDMVEDLNEAFNKAVEDANRKSEPKKYERGDNVVFMSGVFTGYDAVILNTKPDHVQLKMKQNSLVIWASKALVEPAQECVQIAS